MKNIFIIPTDQPSRLHYYTIGVEDHRLIKDWVLSKEPLNWKTASHIYITSNEVIEDVRPHKGKWQLEQGYILNKFPDYLTDLSECNLVILTTDPILIADGVQKIDDEFLEWFIKNPTCELAEVLKVNFCARCYSDDVDECWSAKECSDGKYDKIKYKIIIPQEEHKQDFSKEYKELEDAKLCDPLKWWEDENEIETLEQAAKRHTYNENLSWENDYTKEAFIQGAQWQSKRMYSEIELKELIIKALTHDDDKLCGSLVTKDKEIRTANFGVWFEENKKK